jgi:hypothetical protein
MLLLEIWNLELGIPVAEQQRSCASTTAAVPVLQLTAPLFEEVQVSRIGMGLAQRVGQEDGTMVMDRLTDWIVTAWELIGLFFLVISADLLMSSRSDPNDADRQPTRRAAPKPRSTARLGSPALSLLTQA